jgi:transposase
MIEPSEPKPPRESQSCDLCGFEMVELNCEWLCPNCGYRRDCTDP